MALLVSGIENIMALEIACGIWADGGSFASPRVALVKWKSGWSDKLYQVYVNGQYAGATVDSEQRQILVRLPVSLKTAARIEIFAVDAKDAYTDFSDQIGSAVSQSGRVKLTLLRSQELPVGATVQIYFDNGTGEINYNNPLNYLPIPVWPAWQEKTGFGMSKFGASDFGYDGSAAVGFGKGCFGCSWFGFDADVIEWVSQELATGIYNFAVKVVDSNGCESQSIETGPVTVIPSARPAESLNVSSFDEQTNQLILSVS